MTTHIKDRELFSLMLKNSTSLRKKDQQAKESLAGAESGPPIAEGPSCK